MLKASLSLIGSRNKPNTRSWGDELVVRTLRNVFVDSYKHSHAHLRKAMNIPANKKQRSLCVVNQITLAGVNCLKFEPKVYSGSNESQQRVLVYLHGGAYVAGSPKGYQGFIAELASATG